MRPKQNILIEDKSAERIAFISRTINFAEDVLEDAECEDVLVDIEWSAEPKVLVNGWQCNYDVGESIEIFMDKYDLDAMYSEHARISYTRLYDEVVSTYLESLHYRMKNYASKSYATRREYYLGILFDGRAFLLEGEEDHVISPGIPQCFSAHTHPSNMPVPSRQDLRVITRLLIDRGIGHVIETVGPSLAIYRVRPLTLEDWEKMKNVQSIENPLEALQVLSKLKALRTRYF